MVRTQVQLTPEQVASLKQISGDANESISQIIRDSVDDYLIRQSRSSEKERYERALAVVGKFESSPANVSEEHDRYLGEAFGA